MKLLTKRACLPTANRWAIDDRLLGKGLGITTQDGVRLLKADPHLPRDLIATAAAIFVSDPFTNILRYQPQQVHHQDESWIDTIELPLHTASAPDGVLNTDVDEESWCKYTGTLRFRS